MKSNQPYTKTMCLMALKMFCEGKSFKALNEHFGVYNANILVRRGLSFLAHRYKLQLQKDKESKLGYIITTEDKYTIIDLINNELSENSESEEVIQIWCMEENTDQKLLSQHIKEIHESRMQLQKDFDVLNDKIIRLEQYIKKHTK